MTAQRALEGRAAVIVGGGQVPGATVGNGRATAVVLARRGARVLVVDRDGEAAKETVELVRHEGGDAEALALDITEAGAPEELVAHAVRVLGTIEILHNNVGIAGGDAGPVDLEEAAWDRIVDTNLRAMWLTCKHAVPVLQANGGGAVVNVSSLAAVVPVRGLTAYRVSKAGVNALTQSLAAAYARDGIRVNAVMPGLIDTPAAVDVPAAARGITRDELAHARQARVPLGFQGTAWDVANAVAFLASDEARFVTGVVLPVDGGQSLGAA